MKKSNIITLNPQYFPYAIYFQPIHQLRLLPKTVFIHRPTAYPADVEYARQALSHALHRRYEVVMIEAWWAELPHTLKRWCIKQGARIVLCKTYGQAWNSADVRWCGDVA